MAYQSYKHKFRRILPLLFFLSVNTGFITGQYYWTALPDFPGVSRYAATGFCINGKGYVVTGYHSSGPILLKDTWEYDPVAMTWTQKASFPGTARWYASSFSIAGKGYLGTGETTNDFWEYDPVSDIWTQKNNFPGVSRGEATAFSIGTKGYLGLGTTYGTYSYLQDFWEYNSLTDSWTQLPNFPGGPRSCAIAFVIGQKAYVGTGNSSASLTLHNDIWEFDPVNNSWSAKQNIPIPRTNAVAFSLGNYGYVGMGTAINTYFVFPQDNWRYNPATNIWDSVAALPYYKWNQPVTFTLNNAAYVATGHPLENKVWKFTSVGKVTATLESPEISQLLRVFPNPSSEIFDINYSSDFSGTIMINIVDVIGSVIYSEACQKKEHAFMKEIDFRKYDKGIYFLELIVGDKKIVNKIIMN